MTSSQDQEQTAELALADLFGMRLALGFVLDLLAGYAKAVGGPPTRALILLAASHASARSVSGSMLVDHKGAIIADHLRRPISVAAIARDLSLPDETVRRQVQTLVADGYITRMANGRVVVLTQNVDRPEIIAAIRAASKSFKRLKHAMANDGLQRDVLPSRSH